MTMAGAAATAEAVARSSYGRLVALIAARTRDIAAAEDALAEAFRIALDTWPEQGVPARPEAWLLTVARRSAGHRARHVEVAGRAADTLVILTEERAMQGDDAIPDERLRLLFVCAHPAIDPGVRTALMLQTVLGLDAARIGAAFLVPPATMGQRLVRAKAKIRDAGLRFEVPEREDLPGRLDAVLAAIYAAYGTGWDAVPGADALRGLAPEAIYLGRLVVTLLPDAAEAKGLLALMLHCEARAAARRDDTGGYVPLAAQDSIRWDAAMIAEAEALLVEATARGAFGRFQTEAAIQSLHATSILAGRAPPAKALTALYDLLMIQAPSLGAEVARAAAHGAAHGPRQGLGLLDAIERSRVASYQPYWAVRAHLLELAGDGQAAAADYDRAIGLSSDPAVRAWLTARKR